MSLVIGVILTALCFVAFGLLGRREEHRGSCGSCDGAACSGCHERKIHHV